MEIKRQEKQSKAIKITAEENGKIMGRAYLFIIFNELHDESYGLMEDVFVEDEFRSRGVGSKLVEEVIAEAKAKGCYKLIGQSRYDREKVHELYLKLGFKDYGKNFRMDLKH